MMRASARFLRVLDSHPRAKRATYAVVDKVIATGGRFGLDLRSRRVAFTRDMHRSIGRPVAWLASAHASARATRWVEIDPPGEVVVQPPAARSDAEDSGYTRLWKMVTRGYMLNACDV